MTTEQNVYKKVSDSLREVCEFHDCDCKKCPFSPKFGQCVLGICMDIMVSASLFKKI